MALVLRCTTCFRILDFNVLYKSKILTLVTIEYSCCIMMSIVIGPKWSFYLCCNYIGLLGTGFMQVMYVGRAPRTKETLPDCLKWRRVTRHPLVFRGLTGSQRTPGFGASQRIPRELGFGYPSPLGGLMWSIGIWKPRD